MFEEFTERAKIVMAWANQEAQILNHEYIGTEHILLGVLKENSGVGVTLLNQLGIDLKTARIEVERLVKAGPDMVTMGRLPYTPRVKSIFRLSKEFAIRIDDKHVGTEHLVYGLLAETEGIACQVLRDFKITEELYVDVLMKTLNKTDKEEVEKNCKSCLSFNVCILTKLIDEMSAISRVLGINDMEEKTYKLLTGSCPHYIGKKQNEQM